MKKMILALLMLLAFPGIGSAMAQGRDSNPGLGMQYPPYPGNTGSAGPALWAALNLTPEQGEKMKDLREGFLRESFPLRNEIRSKRSELRALPAQTNADEGKIQAKQKEISVLRSELREKIAKYRLEMRKILTPEQQAKWTYLRGKGNISRASRYQP